MNATALVIGSDNFQRSQLAKHLTGTQVFKNIKQVESAPALFKQLNNDSADMICWAMKDKERNTGWIGKLQSSDDWHDLPLVGFSSNQQSLLRGFNLGACDSINLSIDPQELSARLKCHLKRWQRLLDLRKSQEQLQRMALTDPLTGLGNRATFDMSIGQTSARTHRSGTPYSLLMIDLDHFKWFNDSYGHQTGDKVLQMVAEAISSAARDADICCRYGGEEFAVILPDTRAKNAEVLASRIHRQIGRVSRNLSQSRLPITVSIGISSADQQGSHQAKHLIEEADRALYLAKANGRNRTEVWRSNSVPHHFEHKYGQTQQLAFGT